MGGGNNTVIIIIYQCFVTIDCNTIDYAVIYYNNNGNIIDNNINLLQQLTDLVDGRISSGGFEGGFLEAMDSSMFVTSSDGKIVTDCEMKSFYYWLHWRVNDVQGCKNDPTLDSNL